jgi:hypothetical protein
MVTFEIKPTVNLRDTDIMTGTTTGDFKEFQIKNKMHLDANVILDTCCCYRVSRKLTVGFISNVTINVKKIVN